MSPRAFEYVCDPPTGRHPDDYAPAQPVSSPSSFSAWQIMLRAAGSDKVLARYASELSSAVTRQLNATEEKTFWSWVSRFEYAVLNRHLTPMVMYSHLCLQYT